MDGQLLEGRLGDNAWSQEYSPGLIPSALTPLSLFPGPSPDLSQHSQHCSKEFEHFAGKRNCRPEAVAASSDSLFSSTLAAQGQVSSKYHQFVPSWMPSESLFYCRDPQISNTSSSFQKTSYERGADPHRRHIDASAPIIQGCKTLETLQSALSPATSHQKGAVMSFAQTPPSTTADCFGWPLRCLSSRETPISDSTSPIINSRDPFPKSPLCPNEELLSLPINEAACNELQEFPMPFPDRMFDSTENDLLGLHTAAEETWKNQADGAPTVSSTDSEQTVFSHLFVSVNEAPIQSLVPYRPQNPRHDRDLYTPRFVRGDSACREGWCCFCRRWLVLKNSAFWYDKTFGHGISAATGLPFKNPVAFREDVQEGIGPPARRRAARRRNPIISVEGKCGQCETWVKLGQGRAVTASEGARVLGVPWLKHAHKVRSSPSP